VILPRQEIHHNGGNWEMLLHLVQTINAYLSDYVLVILLIVVGLWFTVKTGFVQIRFFKEGIK
jgi:AGCS family alanine or glycine:cation symporter